MRARDFILSKLVIVAGGKNDLRIRFRGGKTTKKITTLRSKLTHSI